MHFITADLHVEKQSNIPDVEPALFQRLNCFSAAPELQDRYHNMFAHVLVNNCMCVCVCVSPAEAAAFAPVAAELPSARERGQLTHQLPPGLGWIRRSQPHAAHQQLRQHHG